MKRLVFFNYNHNGDIHFSREFVKDIINKTNYLNAVYYHFNSSRLLHDIYISHDKTRMNFKSENLFYEDDQNVYVHTWFHPGHPGYQLYGCTFETLYSNFTEIYKQLGIFLEDRPFYIPKIDYSKFNISNIDLFFNNNIYDKYVFISNGQTLSGQSNNLNLNSYIHNVATENKNCLFILTENTGEFNLDNVIFSKDVIKSTGRDDLVENSYLSTKCDILVGRASGPSAFSIVVENVLSDKKQDIVELCNIKFLDDSFYNKNKKLHNIKEEEMGEYLKFLLKNN